MLKYLGVDRPFVYAARKLLYLFVRTQVLPQDLRALGIDPEQPVVYVMQRRFFSNYLVLSRETRALGLPSPRRPLALPGFGELRSFFFLSRSEPWFGAPKANYSELLRKLVTAACSDGALEVQIVPVSILWGRAPSKENPENSIWKLLVADDWAIRGALKQLLTILLHGRQTLVRLNAPLSLRQMVDGGLNQELTLRKIARVLRVHFRRQREMAIGPDQ